MSDHELGVLASVLRKPELFVPLYDMLKPEHFGHHPYGWAWDAMKTINENGIRLDILTLCDQLDRNGKLAEFMLPDKTHGRLAVSKIKDLYTKEDTAESYARLTLDYYAKRQLLVYAGEMATQAANGRVASDIIADFETKAGKLSLFTGKVENHSYSLTEALTNAQKATEDAAKGTNVFESGIKDLDEIISVQKGELITVAAPTSQGKTAFLATIVLNSARKGKKWLVFTLEGGHIPFTQRLIGQASGIETWRIMRGRIREEEYPAYTAAVEELKNLSIQVIDIPSININQIKTQARKKEYDVIGIDYFQLAKGDGKADRRDMEIGQVTAGAKALAMELDIPVFGLAQIDRGVEKRSDRKPMLSDLRESGSLEMDSDTVMFIYRPDQTNASAVQFMVLKHRNGRTGTADAYFKGETMRFDSANVTEFNPNGHGFK